MAISQQQTTIKEVKGDVIGGNKIVNYNNQKKTINNYNNTALRPVLDILQLGNTLNPTLVRKNPALPSKRRVDSFNINVIVYNTGNAIAYNLQEKAKVMGEFKGKFFLLDILHPSFSNESSIINLFPLNRSYNFNLQMTHTDGNFFSDTAVTFYFYFTLKYSNEGGSNKKVLHKFFLMPMLQSKAMPVLESKVMPEPNSLKYQELKKYVKSIGKW